MADYYVFTGFGCLGFLFYGLWALWSETLSFDWKIAFGVLCGMFVFETITNLTEIYIKKKRKKLREMIGPKIEIIPPGKYK